MSNDNRNSSRSIRPSSPFLKNLSKIHGIAMERGPAPARGELLISEKREQEPRASAGSLASEYRAALVTGDLCRLELLLDQFFQDANMVFEIKKEEMEWQVKSLATFGLSGTLAPLKLSCLLFGSY